MVQARQIFSVHALLKMELGDSAAFITPLKEQALRAVQICIEKCQQADGSYVQSIDHGYQVTNSEPVLYSQAFAIFGLAHAYQISKNENYKIAAKRVVDYLKKYRALPSGGYFELIGGKKQYVSNPHMHLFEAAIEWLEADPEQVWKDLADELYALCEKFFYRVEGRALCEHFDETWSPELSKGDYVFEPGHHYEWAWLILRYGKLRSLNTFELANSLYQTAEKYGVNKETNRVFDEVWSTGKVKKASTRIWPQCERVKAAILISEKVTGDARAAATGVADSALVELLQYFQTTPQGFWFEYADEEGRFHYHPGPVSKASTLYHILGALQQHDVEVRS